MFWKERGRKALMSNLPFKLFEKIVLQLQDLLNNEKCPCANAASQHPCPRCKVSIEQSEELLKAIYKTYPHLNDV